MKLITIAFEISDDMKLKSAIVIGNETGLDDDKNLLIGIAKAIIDDTTIDSIINLIKNDLHS